MSTLLLFPYSYLFEILYSDYISCLPVLVYLNMTFKNIGNVFRPFLCNGVSVMAVSHPLLYQTAEARLFLLLI